MKIFKKNIYKITPASLSIGMNSVVLIPEIPVLDLKDWEVLIKDLNNFCEVYGLRFYLDLKNRNYFFCELIRPLSDPSGPSLPRGERRDLKIKFFKFKQVQNKSLRDFLPQGPDSKLFNSWMTEIQMFLYQHPINILRREESLQTVDILWFEKLGFFERYKKC